MSLLGIDIGTSGCKAAAFSLDGHCLASSFREYKTLSEQPGWAELDSRAVWKLAQSAISEVAAGTHGDPIEALSVSSLGEAMTPVSEEGEILANSILCSDIRGVEYVELLRGAIEPEELYQINPNPPGIGYSMPKLCWIRDHQPELYRATAKFLLWADLVVNQLGGGACTGFSHANRTLLFDIRGECWSERLAGLVGLDLDKLPTPRPAGEVVGTVAPAVASRLGLPGGVRIVVGGHDQCCNALGAGVFEPGQAVCGIGSFECITPVYRRIPEDSGFLLRHGLNVEHHVAPDRFVSFIFNQGGVLVKWFRDTFAGGEARLLPSTENLFRLLDLEMPENPTRLFVLPWFEPTGAPEFRSDVTGVIAGLRTSTSRGEILKAIMESVTYYFVDSLQSLRELEINTSEFTATGGGARSDQWLQIKADILGVPFVRPRYTECSVLGAAILAGLGSGRLTTPVEAAEIFIERNRTFFPDPSRHGIYGERVAKYRELAHLYHDFRP